MFYLEIFMEKTEKREKIKNSERLFYLICLLFLFSAFLVNVNVARAATLYLAPLSGSYEVGDMFTVWVYASSVDKPMNAASGVISFPSDKLKVVSISKVGSVFDFLPKEVSFSNDAGTVNFYGVILDTAFMSARGKLISIDFEAKEDGEAPLSFSSGAVLASDGNGTDILTGTVGVNFQIGEVVADEPKVVASPFVDVVDHWAEMYIEDLRVIGVVSGEKEGFFVPDSQIIRAEAVKIADEIYGIGVPARVMEKPFSDVKVESWYAPYIAALKNVGVISGYNDVLFMPDRGISRAEALKVLLELCGDDLTAEIFTFVDTSASAWYTKYVSYAKAHGLVEGYGDGTFRPDNGITRAEFAKIASLVLKGL